MIDPNEKFAAAMGAGHDSDTAREYAGGSHRMPRVTPKLLSRCCDAEADQSVYDAGDKLGICAECDRISRFYVEGDE